MSSRPPPLSTGPTNLPSTSVLPGTTMAETIVPIQPGLFMAHPASFPSPIHPPLHPQPSFLHPPTIPPRLARPDSHGFGSIFHDPPPPWESGPSHLSHQPGPLSRWRPPPAEPPIASPAQTSHPITHQSSYYPIRSPARDGVVPPSSGYQPTRMSPSQSLRYPPLPSMSYPQHQVSHSPQTQRGSIQSIINPPPPQATAPDISMSPLYAHSKPSPSRYRLHIRQQPIAARACGYGERDRRVIDPPPIIQLFLSDFDPNSDEDLSLVQYQFNIVHCSLYSHPDNQPPADASQLHDSNTGRVTRRLMGSLVGSPLTGIDPDPASSPLSQYLLPSLGGDPSRVSNYVKTVPSTFYIFPDLSCRTQGVYCLHFKVVRAGVEMASKGGRSSMEAEVVSDPFVVFPAKDFPGMKPSSILTKGMKAMGAAVTLKKGKGGPVAKKTPGKRSAGEDPAEEDDEGAESIIEEEVKGEGSRSGSVVIAKKQRRSGSGAGAPRGMNPQRAWEI